MVTLSKHHQEQMDKARDLIDVTPQRDLGFVRSLFFGRVHLDKIMPYPVMDEQEQVKTRPLIERLDQFMRTHIDADQIDADEAIPKRVIRGLGDLGVLGMTVPANYGGGGFSHTAYCRVLERVSRQCSSTAVFIGAHQSIGLKALVLNGTPQQKQQFLPSLARGKTIAAFCLSEPEVGSDAASVQTHARLSPDGRYWVLNGQKRYATNAALAGFMTVMAQSPVSENGKVRDRVTAFIVTPDLPGFKVVSRNRSKCGIRGSWQATLQFKNMRVPRENVLGDLGGGFKVALTVLDYGRCTLSAGCLGSARKALEMAIERANQRIQFGQPIGQFHLIKQKIARMAERVFVMDAMTYLTAGMIDRHENDVMLEAAICKLYSSEAAWRVIDDAVQIWGGEGYMREHGLERALRDARINRIVEGTTEVMTAYIALMGMKGVGEEFEEVLHAVRHPVHNLRRLTDFARHEWRDIFLGHARDDQFDEIAPQLHDAARTLAVLTRRLAREVGKLLATHREKILDLQIIQQRITWSIADLYGMAAVISKLHAMIDGSGNQADKDAYERDMLVGLGFCHHAKRRINLRLDQLHAPEADQELICIADAVM